MCCRDMQKKHRKKPDLWANNSLTASVSHRGPEPPTVCWPSPATWVHPNFGNPPPRTWHTTRSAFDLCVCVCSKATTNRARDGKYATQRVFEDSFHINSIKVLGLQGRWKVHALWKDGKRSTRLWEEPSAFSLHHISLIHFLVEWVKLPAKRNVGQRGRLSEQRAAGKQTKQTQNSQKLGYNKHQDAFKKDSNLSAEWLQRKPLCFCRCPRSDFTAINQQNHTYKNLKCIHKSNTFEYYSVYYNSWRQENRDSLTDKCHRPKITNENNSYEF